MTSQREFAEKVVEELCELDITDSDIMEDDAGVYYVYAYYPDRSIENFITTAVPLIGLFGATPEKTAKYISAKIDDYVSTHKLEYTI